MTPENGLDIREAILLDEGNAICGLLEASQTALVTVGPSLEVTSWNGAAESLFGWSDKEVLGRKLSLLAPDGSLERALALAHGGQEKHFESSCRTRKGKTVVAQIWTCPLQVPGEAYLLMMRDATESKFLEHAFLDAAEREQQRIGREMHDFLCQHILGAAFAVKALAGELDREGSRHAGQLHELARLVNEAVTQVREISRGLHPVELEAEGLPAALQGLASRVSRSVPCEFHCERSAPHETSTRALHAYRIAQEAVAHALQETGATKISIRLSERDGSVQLQISDNGTKEGPLTANPDHLAPKTMRYRARAIHGQLRLKFYNAVGTQVTCTFPRAL